MGELHMVAVEYYSTSAKAEITCDHPFVLFALFITIEIYYQAFNLT